jgi:hypothetical protein
MAWAQEDSFVEKGIIGRSGCDDNSYISIKCVNEITVEVSPGVAGT